MPVIEKINHWMLGQARVEPPVEVVNTQFVTWKPDAEDTYPVQALHYAIMHPHVMQRDSDIRTEDPFSSVGAHNRSTLWTYGIADIASRTNVVDADGNPYGPINTRDADGIDYDVLNLRLNTAALRQNASDFYHSIGEVTLHWIGEPPLIRFPVDTEYFFPNGFAKQK